MIKITIQRPYIQKPSTLCVLFWLVGVFFLQTHQTLADNQGYQLGEIYQLDHHDISDKNWQQVIANPNNKEQLFIINTSGQLYLLEDTIHAQPLLQLNTSPTEKFKKLTAVTLHPSFSLRDQQGYGTFYTAHIEPINENIRTKRLQEKSSELTLKFDAVITEWQFNAINPKKVATDTKREVLRIAVPDESFAIENMSFNPAIKSWNDDFGLLYLSLPGDKKWQKPLYSGVVLRINPAKFGLRSFTIPVQNPFIKNSEIKDAIYLLGGQQIQKFIWPDKNNEQLLLVHQYNNEQLISHTEGRDDWRIKPPKKVILKSDETTHDIVVYRGSDLPHLRNKLLLLKHRDNSWQIDSLKFEGDLPSNQHQQITPQLEWKISPQLQSTSLPLMAINLASEVILIDNQENLVYRLSPGNTPVHKSAELNDETDSDSDSESGSGYMMLILFLLIMGAFYYLFSRNKFSAKALVRQQYANIEVSQSEQQVGLYHRHESSTETILDIVDIVSSEIQLNDNNISFIDNTIEHGFSNDREQELRGIFKKEHIDKMIQGKIRQISLILTVKQNKSYTICLYMRKGSNRITKKGYCKVIDDLIDWCWLVSEKINEEHTGQREKKTPAHFVESTGKQLRKDQNNLPLHHQAAAIRPATHEVSEEPMIETEKINTTVEQDVETSKTSTDTKNDGNKSSESSIDAELVNALEKLVNLKQQGFLSTDEFDQAKAKLLKDLFDNK